MLAKILVVLILLVIISSLFSGLFYLVKDKGTSERTVRALTVRISLSVLLFVLLMLMWLVAAVGILFSEAFAIRSWMFHVANGVVSAWIGAQLFAPTDGATAVAGDPFYVVAAGLAGGLAYWTFDVLHEYVSGPPDSARRSHNAAWRFCDEPS